MDRNINLISVKTVTASSINYESTKMKNEEVIEYALESDNTFSATNENEDVSFFIDLADDELMLQAVFSRC